jgi:NAD(P)-dependent dehydrogenase (short-subunit alcohol dehydrogenase family)
MTQSETHDTQFSVQDVAVIVGGGPGISASCARLFAQNGMRVGIAARNPDKPVLQNLERTHGVRRYACDASEPAAVAMLFQNIVRDLGAPTDCPACRASSQPQKVRFAPDSALEEDGFEPSVPFTAYPVSFAKERGARRSNGSVSNRCSILAGPRVQIWSLLPDPSDRQFHTCTHARVAGRSVQGELDHQPRHGQTTR